MFKDIKGFDGYKINENGVVINKNGHVMRPALSNVGRPRVSLEVYDDNGKLIHRYNKSVSRLVAETFIPNPNNLPIVMHKDDDPLHNHSTNLQWGDAFDNMRDASNKGRLNRYLYRYEIYNDDRSEVIKCAGREGVAKLVGISEKSVHLGVILSGKYAGYTVENTRQKVQKAIYFY